MLAAQLVEAEVVGVLLVFARLGAALMVLPGFGEIYVLPRLRLLAGLLLAAAVASSLPAATVPDEVLRLDARLLPVVVTEVVHGLLIGATVRTVMLAVQLGGTVIAAQSGLAAAVFFDPHEAAQSSVGGNFLAVTALVLMFVTDAHHAVLAALVGSYASLPPGAAPPVGDFSELLTRLIGEATATGLRIAAPVLAVSLLVNAALGALGRLAPSLQLLFVATPAQILLSLGALLLSLAAGMHLFLVLLQRSVTLLSG
jgi:flagellar biosynthetic protein FliR